MSLQPSRVLASLVEPWIKGKRVALVGDASLADAAGLAEALAERGARFVQVLDPRGGQRRTPPPSLAGRVAVGPYGAEALAQPPREAFDLAIVTDLSQFEDPKGECARVRRLVVPGGLMAAAAPNGEAGTRLGPPCEGRRVDYYELYDALAPLYRHVRTFGQAPFVGYALADFGAGGEPDVSVDATLLEGPEEPEWFLAVASDRALDGAAEFSIVALEASGLDRAAAPTDAEKIALAEAQARIAALGSQLETARDRERAHARELEQRTAELGASAAQLEEARREARGARHEERIERAEGERDRARRRADELERETARLTAELERAAVETARAAAALATRERDLASRERDLAAKDRELAAAHQAAEEARAERDALSAHAAELEQALEEARRPRAAVSDEAERAAEIAALEDTLRERGETVGRLERELRASERFARELLEDLEEARAAQQGPPRANGGGGAGGGGVPDDAVRAAELAARLDALATDSARREADWHAANWRVRTLERELAGLRAHAETTARAAAEQAVLLGQVSAAVAEAR